MNNVEQSVYFKPLLPWQTQHWQQLTARSQRLPHGLLFAGMQGIGKRAFVWRFVAWLLCDKRLNSPHGACGMCQSCQWLSSNTHPDLTVLPKTSLPAPLDTENTGNNSTKNSSKKNKSSKATNTSNATKKTSKTTIKIDDIRELQPFINQGSTGLRICVIDNADMMTIAAANALLKSLEEPRQGVHLFLISDNPTKLLPTIKSRVQKVAIDQLDTQHVAVYLENIIKNKALIDYSDEAALNTHISQSLKLANGAPLAALNILTSDWYAQRDTWLKTWLALRVGKRSSIAASDYWQKTLPLNEFIQLSEMMLMDMSRYALGISPLQRDVALDNYDATKQLALEDIQQILYLIEDIKQSGEQNVQEKLGYDRLMASLACL